MNSIICGDALEALQSYEDNVFDAIVCDPPCGIAFMGKSWDSNKGGRDQWIAWLVSIMREALRTLKPGGHCLAWTLPRTSHWTATALEDAGFEIRDVVHHVFGSGFPKSLDVSKAIDRYFDAEREVQGYQDGRGAYDGNQRMPREKFTGNIWNNGVKGGTTLAPITAPATDEARQWQGYGTALKPAAEHWILCRKRLSERSVAENVLRWGTGALNIDACRVGSEQIKTHGMRNGTGSAYQWSDYASPSDYTGNAHQGRFPAHLVLSHDGACIDTQCVDGCPVLALDRQSGTRKSGGRTTAAGAPRKQGMFGGDAYPDYHCDRSEGTASRYFAQFHPNDDVPPFYYAGKASRRERNAGCEALLYGEDERLPSPGRRKCKKCNAWEWRPAQPDLRQCTCEDPQWENVESRAAHHNHHPTVKPLSLIKYLATLIAPPSGVILDMFAGSGTTGVAAVQCGFRYVLIEQSEEYVEIARARIAHAEQETAKKSAAPVLNCS